MDLHTGVLWASDGPPDTNEYEAFALAGETTLAD
jgi:hypothetical protein